MPQPDLHHDRQGQLFIISAPSGAGKTTLVRGLLERVPELYLSISHTTRPIRRGEKDGVDYHFIDPDQFEQMVKQNLFIEHARVFEHAYGTSQAGVQTQLASGQDVLLEIDWQGAQQIRQRLPETLSIFIAPPSFESLAERLHGRAREDADIIAQRLADAAEVISHYNEFDYIVVNDNLETALAELATIVEAARLRLACRHEPLDAFMQGLIQQARAAK